MLTRSPGPTATGRCPRSRCRRPPGHVADSCAQGQPGGVCLSWAPGHDPQMPHVDAEQALSATDDFWTEWADHCRLPARAVRRSGGPVADHPEGPDLRAYGRDRRGSRPLRCRRSSAASATGTTATAGCATPPHAGGPAGGRVTGARRSRGVTGCCAPWRASPRRCRSCTAWTASAGFPSELPWLSGYEGTARCGSGTRRPVSSSSTSSARRGRLSLARQAGVPPTATQGPGDRC